MLLGGSSPKEVNLECWEQKIKRTRILNSLLLKRKWLQIWKEPSPGQEVSSISTDAESLRGTFLNPWAPQLKLIVTFSAFVRKIQIPEAWGIIRAGLPHFLMSSSDVSYMVVKNMTFGERMSSNLHSGCVIFTTFASVSSSAKWRW